MLGSRQEALAEQREQLQAALPSLTLLGTRSRRAQQDSRDPGVGPTMHADEHVLQHGHPAEEALILEGARDADGGDGVRRQGCEVPAAVIEGESAGGRPVNPRDHVEHGGLARAVRTDQPDDLPFLHAEVEAVERPEAPEVLGQSCRLEERHLFPDDPYFTTTGFMYSKPLPLTWYT